MFLNRASERDRKSCTGENRGVRHISSEVGMPIRAELPPTSETILAPNLYRIGILSSI